MANPTLKLINSYTVASSGTITTITLSSIPSTYSDLLIVLSARSNWAGQNRDGLLLTFNNSGGTAYSTKEVRGYDSNSVGSTSTSATSRIDTMRIPAAAATANTFSNISFYIPNYAGSNAKSVSIDSVGQENNSSTSWYIDLASGLWSSSSAINRVDLKAETGYYEPNSTCYIYGISNS